jgi:hypothetical protein
MDYYLEPDNIHRLHEALCDLYCGYIERSVREFRPDGFWIGVESVRYRTEYRRRFAVRTSFH